MDLEDCVVLGRDGRKFWTAGWIGSVLLGGEVQSIRLSLS